MVIPKAYIGAKFTDWPRNGPDSPWGDDGAPIQPRDLLLVGNPGGGKTRCVWACVQHWRLNAIVLKAEAIASQFAAAQSFKAEMTAEDLMATWAEAPLLAIDDLGAARTSELASATILRLLSEREERSLPTIVTTNLGKDGFDPRIQSRIGAYRIIKFPPVDYRKERDEVRQDESEQPFEYVPDFLRPGLPWAERWLSMTVAERLDAWQSQRLRTYGVRHRLPDVMQAGPDDRTLILTHANLISVILKEATEADKERAMEAHA